MHARGLSGAPKRWAHLQICYPKPSKKALFEGLVTQLNSLKLPFVNADDLPTSQLSERYDVILDAMFGFSFHGAPRPPFDKLVNLLTSEVKDCLVASVDIPSGWHVEEGPGENAIKPDMLVSLTTPKKGCRHFQGTHYLGGRFVPPEIAERFGLKLPAYPGTSMCVRIDGGERSAAAAPEAGGRVNVADMRQDESRMTGGIDIASMPVRDDAATGLPHEHCNFAFAPCVQRPAWHMVFVHPL